ncbi:hybrid sensor histidine kinase/response regulator [Pleionea sp. CnH1-48]|uniref:hybrid sensor histidine kinase/response regulator n=1 Tax=Pleionea sp. CnH1-48 TaxID=2954494 RepID=UPI0020976624|nr:hybrid sensor histidine kinase/response regulator [Pleionea sp. CnH1-48]MCO7223465.1 response regulator [Pleionea sp. CnH1-48]
MDNLKPSIKLFDWQQVLVECESLQALVDQCLSAETDADATSYLMQYQQHFYELLVLLEPLGSESLSLLYSLVGSDVDKFTQQQKRPCLVNLRLLKEWPQLFSDCFARVTGELSSSSLIAVLSSQHWSHPLSVEQADCLAKELTLLQQSFEATEFSASEFQEEVVIENSEVPKAEWLLEEVPAAMSSDDLLAEVVEVADEAMPDFLMDAVSLPETVVQQKNSAQQEDTFQQVDISQQESITQNDQSSLEEAFASQPDEHQRSEVFNAYREEVMPVLQECLMLLASPKDDREVSPLADHFVKLADVAHYLDLSGSSAVFFVINQWLQPFVDGEREPKLQHFEQLTHWTDYYIKVLDSGKQADIEALTDSTFELAQGEQLAFDKKELADWLAEEQIAEWEDGVDDMPSMPTTAEANDVALVIAEDAQTALIDMFLEEAPVHVDTLTEALNRYASQCNKDDLIQAQRAIHTLKGAAATLSVAGVENIAHAFEDILEFLIAKDLEPAQEVIDFLMGVADALADCCDYLVGGGALPENLLAIYQSVLDAIQAIRNEGSFLSVLDFRSGENSDGSTVEPQNFEPQAEYKDNSVLNEKKEAEGSAQSSEKSDSSYIRVPEKSLESMLNALGESTILRGHVDDTLMHFGQHLKALSQLAENIRSTIFNLENFVETQSVTDWEKKSGRDQQENQFDPLEVNRMNELHTYLSQVIESSSDIRQVESALAKRLLRFDELHQKQQDISKTLERQVMGARMVTVKSVSARLERCVRQVSRLLGKSVKLEIQGEHTLIDIKVINALLDPLMHLLRNAVDHGIESLERRQQLNKPEQGSIRLSFEAKGHSFIVKCQDDGGGIQYDDIRHRAIVKGLITEQQVVDRKTLNQFLLQPGFSTREKVSATSGRGIGMDVVAQSLRQMGGFFQLESQQDKGCLITLSMAATMVTQHILMVRVGEARYGIPSSIIEQAFAAQSGIIKMVASNCQFEFIDKSYPLFWLGQFLGQLPEDTETTAENNKPGFLLNKDNETLALFVDEVLGCRDVVLKSFGHYLPRLPGTMGGALMGDGHILPILDINELMASNKTSYQSSSIPVEPVQTLGSKKILVVEDSLSTRRALEQLLGDTGYEVRTAIDGIEAIQSLKQWQPDLVLSDLELPRLNGLELTAHLRSQSSFKQLPVIMLTSRYTEKHRQHAQKVGVNRYLTKPYVEDEVLSHIEQVLEECA